MLLVIDIGNTNITVGIYKQEDLIGSFRIMTQTPRTSDEYGMLLSDLVVHRDIKIEEIEDVIISSVVPQIMHSFNNAIRKYFKKEPMEVRVGTKTGIKVATPNPNEIGADRIVDAVAAYDTYGGPVIVLDFGTATTYDLILEDGSFVAGITSPGIKISAKALWQDTARLPEIEIKKPDSILAKETISSMQAGLIYGCIGQTEYIIDKIKEESGLHHAKVIATGGLGRIIADETEKIDIYDPDLSLAGLRLIYNKSKGIK